MRAIHLFYSRDSDACHRAMRILREVVEVEDDIMLVLHDIDTEPGRRKAQDLEVSTVPTTIVDGTRIIRGVPHSPEQVLGDR